MRRNLNSSRSTTRICSIEEEERREGKGTKELTLSNVKTEI